MRERQLRDSVTVRHRQAKIESDKEAKKHKVRDREEKSWKRERDEKKISKTFSFV